MATSVSAPLARDRRWPARQLQRVSLWPRLVIGVTLGFCALFAVFTLVALHAADASSHRIARERLVIAEMVASDVHDILARARSALREASPQLVYDASAPPGVVAYDVRAGVVVRVAPAARAADAAVSASRPFVSRALATRGVAVSGPFRLSDGRPGVAVAAFRHGRVSVLVLDAGSAAFMRPLVQAMRLGKTGHGELVGPAGIVIASTDDGDALQPGEHRPFYREMLRRRDTDVQTVPYVEHEHPHAQEQHVMAWAPIVGASWGVAVGGSEADTYGPVQRLRRTLLFAGAGALLLLWLIALGGARVLVRPVRTLTRAARDMASGDLERRIAVVEGGEIGVLADSLESMRTQLRDSLQTVRRWGEELEVKVEERTAELQERNRQLAAVTAVATAGSRSFELESMLDLALAAIIEHARVDGAAFRLFDARAGTLGPAYSRGAIGALACAGRTIELGECLCGNVAADGKPRYGSSCAECLETNRAIAVIPLRAHGKRIGTLSVTRVEPHTFARDERRTLAAIADQLAVAVDNVRMLDELAGIEAQRELQRVKSDLIAAVSHELRTPLGFIKGYATTLLRDPGVDVETRTQFLEIIDDETTKLEGMVEELLDTSRLQGGRLELAVEDVPLRPLVDEVCAKMRARVGELGGELLVLPGASPVVVADPLRVEQILENLLENAARYSPPTAPIEVALQEDERFAVLSVTDRGEGVPEDERARIFEPFFRGAAGRRSGERGVGLGLAICRGLAEAQGGTLRLAETARGARFELVLPLA